MGIGGVVVGGLGLGNALHAGSLSQQAIIMMASGGSGTLLFLIPGIIVAVKLRAEGAQNRAEGAQNHLDIHIFGFNELDNIKAYPLPIGGVPHLPRDIREILNSDCPFWPHKKVRETHMLILVPGKFNAKNFEQRREGVRWVSQARGEITEYPKRTHWALLTREIVPNTKNKFAAEQREMAQNMRYELADVHEVGLSMMLELAHKRKKLYNSGGFYKPIIQAEDIDRTWRLQWTDDRTIQSIAYNSNPQNHVVNHNEAPSPEVGAAFVLRFFPEG